MKRRILSIFLASPNDLQEERKATREIVDRINRVFSRRMGWHIELLGWEDTLPGFSRPQSLINKDVDSCDLFLGILWRRWGQPTGLYESGFEEEFTLARKRKEKTGKPEIWVFFKNIDQESLQDPGDQLKKVIKFKNDQIERRELLFKNFSDKQTWREMIQDILTAYMVNLVRQESKLVAQEKSRFKKIQHEVKWLLKLEMGTNSSPITLYRKQLKKCKEGMSEVMSNENWDVRFRNLLLAIKLVSLHVKDPIPVDFFDDSWLTPNKNTPPYFPWILSIVILFGEPELSNKINGARSRILSYLNRGYSSYEKKEHFILNLLQGVRASLVRIDNSTLIEDKTFVSQIRGRLQQIFKFIDKSYFDRMPTDEPEFSTRLLLSWADLIQIEQFILCNFKKQDSLGKVVKEMLSKIKKHLTEEQYKKGAEPLRSVIEEQKLWVHELSLFHNENMYPLDYQKNRHKAKAILSFLEICVRTRKLYSGKGWDGWKESILIFGTNSKFPQMRKLAKFVAKLPTSERFSSRY